MAGNERLSRVGRGIAFLILQGALVPVALAAPANYHTVVPCRVFDSRLPANAPALSSGVVRTIGVAGQCGVPASATSVALNLTVTQGTATGHLRLFRSGPAPAPYSSINYSAGQTRGNNTIAQLSVGGQVDDLPLMAAPGTVDLILDVFGYFLDDASPTAVDDSHTVTEDASATTIDVLANDTDPDGGPISVSSVTQPANGTVVITNGGADLTYQPDPDYCNAPPGTTPDTFTYTLLPGGSTATVSVTVNCVNDAPSLGGAGTVAFTEDGPPVLVAPALTVVDVDDANLESATVMISNLLDSGSELLATNTAGTSITANYVAPNLLLTGTDSVANYELVLRRVTYENTSASPDIIARFVAFVANDGSLASNAEIATVMVTPANDAPVLTAGAGSPTFTEDGGAVAIDPGLTVTDADDVNLESATVTITNLLDVGAEALAANTTGTSIGASYAAPTLTLTGSDTLANYQAVLRSVTYANTSQNPNTAARSLAFRVNDGTDPSNIVTTLVTVVAVNDAPAVAGTGVVTFTEDAGAVVVASGLLVTDVDNTSLASATVTITNLLNAGFEVLTANTGATSIVANYVAPTLTLTGTDTVANYQAVLRTVAYNNVSNAPNPTPRSVAFTVNDGSVNSNTALATVQVVPVNDPPTLTTNPISYASAGNTQLHVAGDTIPGVASIADPQGALTKSSPTDVDGPVAPSVVAASGASANGGSFTIDTDGSFTYVPPVNFTGPDSFTYQVTDSLVSVIGTITVNVSSVVWYVRDVVDASNPAGGDGRSTNAFETLAGAQGASLANHFIFVFAGNTATTPLAGGIVLKDGQKLYGEGVGLSVPAFPNIVAAGTPPRINAAGDAVSVPATAGNRNGVEIRGLDLQGSVNAVDVTASGANAVGVTISYNNVRGAGQEGIDLNAGSTGLFTATVQSNTIAATGNGFDARTSAAGQLRVDFSTNTVFSGANAVVIDGSGGGTTTIAGFASNSVNANTVGTGIAVNVATFDATPGAPPFDPVSGGNTAIGVPGDGMGGAGMILTNISGNLAFTDLDVFADGGAGLRVTGTGAFTGSAGTQVTVGAGVAILVGVAGPAVDLASMTASLPLVSLTSTNSITTGVSLLNVVGTLSAPAGSITNPTGTDFAIDGSNATVTYGGTITDDVGPLVTVANTTGGTKTFSGAITDGNDGDGSGIALTNNTGATINFVGGVVLSTGANPAFTATGGGTVNVCDENPCAATTGGLVNTLTTTTGTALNVANTTIGSSGLTFRSISANGASNGVVLNATGSSGGLTVTGVGTTAGSGGTIQNISGRGASFINAVNIDLRNMNFTNTATSAGSPCGSAAVVGANTGCNAAIHINTVTTAVLDRLNLVTSGQQGINAIDLTGLTLTNSTLSGLGNAADEDGLHFHNLLGTNTISNTSVASSGDDNVNVQNRSSVASTINITGGTFNTGVLGSGLLFGIRDTADTTINISGVTADNNFSGGVVADGFDTATLKLVVTTSTITNNNDGVQVSANNGASQFDINNNDFIGNDFLAVTLLKAAFSTGGTLEGAVRNNNPITIANGRTTDAISVFQAGGGALKVAITGNVFNYAGTQRAILVQAGQDGNGSLDATISGNNIDIQLDGAGNAVTGILAQSAITGPGNTAALCADFGGAGGLRNTFTHSLGGVMAGGDIRVRQRNDGTVRLPGYAGAATDLAAVVSYLSSRNTVVSPPTATADSTGFAGGAACAVPTIP